MLDDPTQNAETTIGDANPLVAGSEMGADVRFCQGDSVDALPKPPSVTQVDAWPIDPAQVRAVRLMSAGCTTAYIARALKVSERTIYRWKKDEAFRAALREASRIGDKEVRWMARAALRSALGRLTDSLHATGSTQAASALLRNRSLWRMSALIEEDRW